MSTVPEAILAATPDPRVRLAMLMGSRLEGGWGPTYDAGDSGGSTGPYQINHNAGMHSDISVADTLDPVKATDYMLGEYTAAVTQGGHNRPAPDPSLWSTNPELAGEMTAAAAEGPQVDYFQGQGQGAVDAAYNSARAVLGGQTGQLTAYVPGTHTHIPGTGAGSSWNPFGGVITGAEAIVVKAIFVVLGVGLVGAGLWRAVAPHTQQMTDNAKTAATLAAL